MATLKIGGIEASELQKAELRDKLNLANLLKLDETNLTKDDTILSAENKQIVRNEIEVMRMVKLTQAAYDALSPPDEETVYIIVG